MIEGPFFDSAATCRPILCHIERLSTRLAGFFTGFGQVNLLEICQYQRIV